jgi:hypothetical protein
MYFPCARAKLPSVGRIVLTLNHVSWPLKIEFTPWYDVYTSNGEWKKYEHSRNIYSAIKPGDCSVFRPSRLVSFMGDTSIAQPFVTAPQIENSLNEAFGDKKVIPSGSSKNEWRFRMPTEGNLSIEEGCLESLDFSRFESNKFLAANIKNDTKKYQSVELGVLLKDIKGLVLIAFESQTVLSPNESKKIWLSRGGLPKHSLEGLKPVVGVVYCNSKDPNSDPSEQYLKFKEHTYQLGMAIVQNGFYETIKGEGRYKGFYSWPNIGGVKRLGVCDLDKYKKKKDKVSNVLWVINPLIAFGVEAYRNRDKVSGLEVFDVGMLIKGEKFYQWEKISKFESKEGYVLFREEGAQEWDYVLYDPQNANKVCEILENARIAFTRDPEIPDGERSAGNKEEVRDINEVSSKIKAAFKDAQWVKLNSHKIYISGVQGDCDKLLPIINICNDYFDPNRAMVVEDIVVGIIESDRKGVLITETDFYFIERGKKWVKIPLKDIKSVDWERMTNGNIFINEYALNFLADYRKPFVDLFRMALGLKPVVINKSYEYKGHEIRENGHGGYEVFYDGKVTGFEAIKKSDCEKWIRSKR